MWSKMRTLSLCSRVPGPVPLEELKEPLAARSIEDVENFVIDAVSTGIIDAKIDHSKSSVDISRVSYRCLDANTWKDMDERLAMWRDSINNVLAVHDQHAAPL